MLVAVRINVCVDFDQVALVTRSASVGATVNVLLAAVPRGARIPE